MKLNVNTNAVVKFSRDLQRLHRSAFPSAIRGALNKTAFDVKTNTMPTSANKTFVNRSPNFFKANSKVEVATGFNINSMKSKVGFIESKLKGSNNYAIDDLEKQEEGGSIGGKSFVPLDTARKSGYKTAIKNNFRLTNINKISKARNSKGNNKKQKFIKAVIKAGRGGFVLGGSNQILFKIERLSIKKKFKVKLLPLYRFKRNGKIKVKPTHFMETASNVSHNKIEKYYIEEAKFQINKYMKK